MAQRPVPVVEQVMFLSTEGPNLRIFILGVTPQSHESAKYKATKSEG
jgi:hypothetical protein